MYQCTLLLSMCNVYIPLVYLNAVTLTVSSLYFGVCVNVCVHVCVCVCMCAHQWERIFSRFFFFFFNPANNAELVLNFHHFILSAHESHFFPSCINNLSSFPCASLVEFVHVSHHTQNATVLNKSVYFSFFPCE